MTMWDFSSFAALKKSQSEADAMKKQLEGLAREYDRVLTEHQELQVMLISSTTGCLVGFFYVKLNSVLLKGYKQFYLF